MQTSTTYQNKQENSQNNLNIFFLFVSNSMNLAKFACVNKTSRNKRKSRALQKIKIFVEKVENFVLHLRIHPRIKTAQENSCLRRHIKLQE
jgi:hypothetical protein